MNLGVGWEIAAFIFGAGLILIMFSGIPVAFAFGIMNLLGAYYIFGNLESMSFLVHSAVSSVQNINLTAIPFFVLMGTIFVRSGLSKFVLDRVGIILAGVQGAGAYATVFGGVILGALMGASIASTTVLATVMLTELRKCNYSKLLSVGCIIGAGTLSILIPPSMPAVLLGSLAGVSIPDLLVAGIGPAIVLTILLMLFVFVRVKFFENNLIERPAEEVSVNDRFRAASGLAPLLFPVFSVTGATYFGIATSTEASALGVLSTLIIAYSYTKFGWRQFQLMVMDATIFSAMIFFIVMSSKAYGQIFAILGISQGFVNILSTFNSSPMIGILIFLALVTLMGCFMDAVSVIFVAIPLYLGAINALNLDPIWFGTMFILVVGTGAIHPPFGLNLFAVKSVAPPEISMMDMYKTGIVMTLIEFTATGIILFQPEIVNFLLK